MNFVCKLLYSLTLLGNKKYFNIPNNLWVMVSKYRWDLYINRLLYCYWQADVLIMQLEIWDLLLAHVVQTACSTFMSMTLDNTVVAVLTRDPCTHMLHVRYCRAVSEVLMWYMYARHLLSACELFTMFTLMLYCTY